MISVETESRLRTHIRQALITCLLLAMLALATGCSSWTVCTGGTVVPAVKNFQFSLCPSGITWKHRELRPGCHFSYGFYIAPKHPTKAFVEFDDEGGKHHSLAASIRLPWFFDGKILLLLTRKEFLGQKGDIASIDRVKLQDYGHGIGCKPRTVTMLEKSEENYDDEYLLKVYLGDQQDFNDNGEKFIYSLQREDEHCVSNIIFLTRDIPEEYEITPWLKIGIRGSFNPIASKSGKRPDKQRNELDVYQGAKGELLWRRNDISAGPLSRIEIGISSNGETIMYFDACDFGLPYNFCGDIAVFLVRDGGSYQLRIFVDKPGSLVAYKDYNSLCKALDERYDSFPRQDVRFDYIYRRGMKPRKNQGMCYLIDSSGLWHK
jgi:hypothetical protein